MKKLIYNFLTTSLLLISLTVQAYTPLQNITEIISPVGEFPADQFWKVAVVQWNPTYPVAVGITDEEAEKIKQSHREAMAEFIKKAAAEKAKYIVLSEFAVTGYPDIPELSSADDNFRNRNDVKPYVESLPGPSTVYFGELAKSLGVWIQFGLAEVDPVTDQYFNSAVVINDKGELVAKYRKQQLFKSEVDYVSAGTENVTFVTPAGIFGLLICADVYDYAVLNKYKISQVDVLSLSTSWAQQNTGMGYFKRAAQFVGSFLLAANQNYFPDSGVINKDGTTQSHIRQSEDTIAYGFLPLK